MSKREGNRIRSKGGRVGFTVKKVRFQGGEGGKANRTSLGEVGESMSKSVSE